MFDRDFSFRSNVRERFSRDADDRPDPLDNLRISDSIGLQVLVYDTETGEVEDLTADIGRGFGNSSLRYAWAMEQVGDDIFVGSSLVNPDLLSYSKLLFRIQSGLISTEALGDTVDFLEFVGESSPIGDTSDYGIYRYRDGAWEQVLGPQEYPEFGGFGVRELRKVVVDDGGTERTFLFAGTITEPFPGQDNEEVASLWVSEDNGDTWSEIETGPSAPGSGNTSYRSLAQYGDELIVTTQDVNGGAVWSYDPLTGEWVEIAVIEDVVIATEVEVVEEPSGQIALYVGTASGYIGGPPLQIHRFVEDPGTGEWSGENITPNAFTTQAGERITRVDGNQGEDSLGNPLDVLENPFDDGGALTMFYADGKLFYGTSDYVGAAGLAYIELDDVEGNPVDPEKWVLVTADGFGNEANTYIWSADVDTSGDETVMYIGTFDQDNSFEMLTSTDGDSWERLTSDAFGTKNNWGIRELDVLESDPSKVLLGTASTLIMPGLREDPNDDLLLRMRFAGSDGGPAIGDAKANFIVGSQQYDALFGLGGDDLIMGSARADAIDGGHGDDDISGGLGADVLRGGWGDDWIAGGRGGDRIFDGPGFDTMAGGPGFDKFHLTVDGEVDVIVDYEPGDRVMFYDDWGRFVRGAWQMETPDGVVWMVDGEPEALAAGLTL
ncbi:calcium-binding protein [Acuticoccus sp. I52.16.1]|uniref:calcium-binding protein n=1 Tax=Acuticoccus sp. I52.16.1 TaxID=2928472 RepID=UPI001FD2F335|nr:calcium-binding protein [Acuticoccus sp. I52.16.1]UOM32648.1 hypothetical protein MRB58_12220 [Acuticoccus sp. I52.16.1]